MTDVPRFEAFRRPPGPNLGFWSWRYLDLFRSLRLVTSKRVKGFYTRFPAVCPPGSEFPAVALDTTDGVRLETRAFLGKKHFVLFTGAIT